MSRVLEEWTDFDVASFALGRHLGVFPEAGGIEEFQKVKGVFWSNDALGETLEDILGMMVDHGHLEFTDERLVLRGYPVYRWRDGVAPAFLPGDMTGLVEPEVAVEHLVALWRARKRTSGGVELTDEVLDRLAVEAEAGYDVTRIRQRRKRGTTS